MDIGRTRDAKQIEIGMVFLCWLDDWNDIGPFVCRKTDSEMTERDI